MGFIAEGTDDLSHCDDEELGVAEMEMVEMALISRSTSSGCRGAPSESVAGCGVEARQAKEQACRAPSCKSTPPATPPPSCTSQPNKRTTRKTLSVASDSDDDGGGGGGSGGGGGAGWSGDGGGHGSPRWKNKCPFFRNERYCFWGKKRELPLRVQGRTATPCFFCCCRCCCLCRSRRRCGGCVLGVVLCLAAIPWLLSAGLHAFWGSGCTEGCYEAAATRTGAEGPEQVHLAYSGVDVYGNPTGMTVMWTSAAGEAPPVVQYGLTANELNCTTQGTSTSYLDTVHHRVSLEDLTPGTRFFYRCGHPTTPAYDAGASDGLPAVDIYLESGSGNGGEVDSSETNARDVAGYGSMWSHVSSFVTAPGPERWTGDGPWERPISVAVVGDFGLVGAGATFDRLRQLVDDGEVDFIIHLGDIAYADDAFLERLWSFGYEEKWDAFMRRASHGYASRVPYMVVPGNHEAECHSPACLFSRRKLRALKRFGAYNARFRMPSLESGAEHGTAMWYSFNVGPVHFVIVDTETDFPKAGGDQIAWFRGAGNGGFGDQLAWLEEDLARAQQERDVRPWVIVAGHRPVYARESAGKDGRITYGSSERVRLAFEPLLDKYEVDVYLGGHVHTFERSFPVVDNTVRFGSSNNDSTGAGPVFGAASNMLYEEPAAPVHIINGAGGNIEGMTPPKSMFPGEFPRWHAHAVNMVDGVGILSFTSMSEMRSMFITSDSPAEVLDELTIRHRRL